MGGTAKLDFRPWWVGSLLFFCNVDLKESDEHGNGIATDPGSGFPGTGTRTRGRRT